MALKQIMTFEDEASISFVESVLRSEGVRYHVTGRRYAIGESPGLLIHENDLDRARSILIEIGFENRVYSEKRLKGGL